MGRIRNCANYAALLLSVLLIAIGIVGVLAGVSVTLFDGHDSSIVMESKGGLWHVLYCSLPEAVTRSVGDHFDGIPGADQDVVREMRRNLAELSKTARSMSRDSALRMCRVLQSMALNQGRTVYYDNTDGDIAQLAESESITGAKMSIPYCSAMGVSSWVFTMLGLMLILYPLYFIWFRIIKPRRYSPSACVHCGYDLTGNTSGVCSECGAPLPADMTPPPADLKQESTERTET
jgi:hypothetical protein